MSEVTGLLNHPWISRRKLDVVEYHRMGAAGILHEDDRVELIEGELIAMAPIGERHAGTSMTLTTRLVRAVGDDAIVSVGNPVRLDSYNEPQPDFALLRPRPGGYTGRHPGPAVAEHGGAHLRREQLGEGAGHAVMPPPRGPARRAPRG